MKLFMDVNPYRLEQGYDLGFGPSVYDIMAELILTFRGPEQDILFLYTNWNRDSNPRRDGMIKSSARSFHAGVIYDPDQAISQKVKKILLQHYAPELDPNEK